MARVRASVGARRITGRHKPSVDVYTLLTREALRPVFNQLNALISDIEGATPEICRKALEPVFEESQYLVPVDTGELKASGFLEADRRGAQIGYAKRGDPFYAVFVHEQLENYHEPPTQAKFLQQPLEEQMDEIPGRIAAGVQMLLARRAKRKGR